MSTRNRIPPLLEPYLRLPPEASQLLLSGVLDASPQWLVTRLLRSALASDPSSSNNDPEEKQENDSVSVILVSWLRDFEFWKSEARRGAGIDLARLAQQNRFAYIDGLTQLFPVASSTASPSASPPPPSPRTLPARTPIPSRGGPLPSRGPPPPTPQPIPQQQPTTSQAPSQQPNTHTLISPSLQATHTTISKATTALSTANPGTKILLILDSPTLLLATTPQPSASALSSFLLSLRSQVHSTAIVVEADAPFLDAARPHHGLHPTPLEAEHAAFVVQQAHVSRWVVALRPLDTGRARDVSGVVRASRGGAWDEVDEDDKHESKELEALYFVQADGGVRVFERGEASVG